MSPSEAIRILLDAGQTQKQVAAGVSAQQSTINRILHGKLTARWDLAARLVVEANKVKRRRSVRKAA